jgi:hypothetical protein
MSQITNAMAGLSMAKQQVAYASKFNLKESGQYSHNSGHMIAKSTNLTNTPGLASSKIGLKTQ